MNVDRPAVANRVFDAFDDHTIRPLKRIDQAVLLVKYQYDEDRLKLNIGMVIEGGMHAVSLFN